MQVDREHGSARDETPSSRVALLRTSLLTGRGPGASPQEIAEHTRDRPLLGAVPVPIERALVARQGDRLRAGTPIAGPDARHRARRHWRRAALTGAAAALVIRSLVTRAIRKRRYTRW